MERPPSVTRTTWPRTPTPAQQVSGFLNRKSEEIAAKEDMLLRTNTVFPGQTVEGLVPFMIKTQPGQRFRVSFELEDWEATTPGITRN